MTPAALTILRAHACRDMLATAASALRTDTARCVTATALVEVFSVIRSRDSPACVSGGRQCGTRNCHAGYGKENPHQHRLHKIPAFGRVKRNCDSTHRRPISRAK